MNLNYLIYILAIIFGVLALAAPKAATYLIGAYLVSYGILKLVIALS